MMIDSISCMPCSEDIALLAIWLTTPAQAVLYQMLIIHAMTDISRIDHL